MVLRTIAKVLGFAIVALVVVVGVLYQFFGLRFVMDGSGTPHPRFVQTSQLQAERIERHREAQRAEAESAAPRPAVAESTATAAAAPLAAPLPSPSETAAKPEAPPSIGPTP